MEEVIDDDILQKASNTSKKERYGVLTDIDVMANLKKR